MLLEIPILHCIHKALNSNMMCAQMLQVKLRNKNSSFADSYRFLPYNYNLTNSGSINETGSLLAKLKINNIEKTQST